MAPLVFIPGTLCDARLFAPMMTQMMAGDYRVHTLQADSVAEEAQLLLEQAPERFVAVGFSLGGFVLLEIMRRAPQRLAGAAFIASNALPLQPGAKQSRLADVALARRHGVASVIERLWPSYVGAAQLDNAEVRKTIEAMAEAVGVERFARQTKLVIDRPDSQSTIRDATMPILIVCGGEDRMCPPDRCASLGGSANARFVELDGVGHFVPLEAPAHAAAAVDRWLEVVACCSA